MWVCAPVCQRMWVRVHEHMCAVVGACYAYAIKFTQLNDFLVKDKKTLCHRIIRYHHENRYTAFNIEGCTHGWLQELAKFWAIGLALITAYLSTLSILQLLLSAVQMA